MDVGFIGLGEMGRAMAANLLKAGHRVRAWNRSPGAARALGGAVAVAEAGEAFAGDAVVTMLADDAAVRAVVLDGGLLDRAPENLVHVMMATISVALARELDERHRARGIAFVSAPVFGRPDAAAAAKLNILAAGDDSAVARVEPLFDAMGQKTWRLGAEPHRAAVVKIAGNTMIAAAIEAMGEATALARAYGVQPADILDILTTTMFASPVYQGYGRHIATGTFEPAGFRLRLGLKDVRLALQAGDEAGVPLPFASVLRDNLLEAVARGDGDKDWAALARVVHRRAGLDG